MISINHAKQRQKGLNQIHYVPINGTVPLPGTQLQSSLSGQLVNGTPHYPDKINKDRSTVSEDLLSGQTLICPVNGCPVNGD